MRKLLSLIFIFSAVFINAENPLIKIPDNLRKEFPRTTGMNRDSIRNLIEQEKWAKQLFDQIKKKTDNYVAKCSVEPQWLVSRLQMYWKSHWTDVFIKGEKFAYAGGSKAPVPTPRYTGTRAANTIYQRPKLEDILPFMDDDRGMYFINGSKPDKPFEWADPAETGRIIESINREVTGIARDAAFLFWVTGEEKYASLAREVFDVYMTGMYYRNVPVDLFNGHQQTLVGLSSFEVIHEDILNELVPLYDFLYADLQKNKADKMSTYASVFRKWADNLIDNGVPHNNWDLFKSGYILNIALILEDNNYYPDGKGREYYIDYVLNRSGIRQWSLPRLMDYGFDKNTGIWAECPGYSLGVVADFANFISWFDRYLDYDILPQFPVITKAVAATPQYLFPNGNIVGFGDTHPDKLRTDFFVRMISNAQKYGKKKQEKQFTAMLKLFNPDYNSIDDGKVSLRPEVSSFFADKPLKPDPAIAPGKIEDYVTTTFWAPNVSWFVQRNGMDAGKSLMISLNGSEGNHMHANGISMELYGKGYTLAPDAGIGNGYFSLNYSEYYGQFPAHNTVCVDGISSYPIMKSNHAFELRSCFPKSGMKGDVYNGITYGDVYFLEPESHSDQTRTTGIITTSGETGYYVDIFRSKKINGGDKMHDYFYHNLGQEMQITDSRGDSLNFKPTQELSFAGGNLMAYSYLFNKQQVLTDKDIKATFTIRMKDGNNIAMNMWMKGEKKREIFSALAPYCEGLSRQKGMPYNIKDTPMLTFVARQKGNAWEHPFVSVFEPSKTNEPASIESVSYFKADNKNNDFVGIKVVGKQGRVDHIFSNSSNSSLITYKGMSTQSVYSVVGVEQNGDRVFMMGNGTLLSTPEVKIKSEKPIELVLLKKLGAWSYMSTGKCVIRIEGRKYQLEGVTEMTGLK